jgi:sirohydrochlorin cobaltochelatase
MTSARTSTAIVLFAHGSRDPLWHKPIEAVAAQINLVSPDTHVVCAYLEISSPDLATAASTLVNRGVQSIAILPLFLGVGKHAREDLPRLVADLQQVHPDVQFNLKPSVGEEARMVDLLAKIALDSL